MELNNDNFLNCYYTFYSALEIYVRVNREKDKNKITLSKTKFEITLTMRKLANPVSTSPNLQYAVNALSQTLFNVQKVDSKRLAWPTSPTSPTSRGNKQSIHCKCDPWTLPPEVPFTMPVFNISRTKSKVCEPYEMNEINKTRFFAFLNDGESLARTIPDICNWNSDSALRFETYNRKHSRKINAQQAKVLPTTKSKEYCNPFANLLLQHVNHQRKKCTRRKRVLQNKPHGPTPTTQTEFSTTALKKYANPYEKSTCNQRKNDIIKNEMQHYCLQSKNPNTSSLFLMYTKTKPPDLTNNKRSATSRTIQQNYKVPLHTNVQRPQSQSRSMSNQEISREKTQRRTISSPVGYPKTKTASGSMSNPDREYLVSLVELPKSVTQSGSISHSDVNINQKLMKNLPNLAKSRTIKKKPFLIGNKKMGGKFQSKDKKIKLSKAYEHISFTKKNRPKRISKIQEKFTKKESLKEITSAMGENRAEGMTLNNNEVQTNYSFLMEHILENLQDESNQIIQANPTKNNDPQINDFEAMAARGRLFRRTTISKPKDHPTVEDLRTEIAWYRRHLSKIKTGKSLESNSKMSVKMKTPKYKSNMSKPRKSKGHRKLHLSDIETQTSFMTLSNVDNQMDKTAVSSLTDSTSINSHHSNQTHHVEWNHSKFSVTRMKDLWEKSFSSLRDLKGVSMDKISEMTNKTTFQDVDPHIRSKLSLILYELIKSRDSIDSLRLKLVKQYAFEDTLTLSDLENINISDINLNDLLYYPYKSIFPDSENITKAVTTKPKIRKKAPKKIVEEIKPLKKPYCNICRILNQNRTKAEEPWMTKMKLDWNRIELKAYIKYRQIFQSNFDKLETNRCVFASSVNPRTICDQMYEFCKKVA